MKRVIQKHIFIPTILGMVTGVLPQITQVKAASLPAQYAVSNLDLPNGIELTTAQGGLSSTRWNGLQISLQLLGTDGGHPYGQSMVGNHSQILNQRFMTTQNGRAWFALNERTPPAAEQSTKATYEYWVAMERTSPSSGMHFDYCVEVTGFQNRAKTKKIVLNLVKNWEVPPSADIVHVSITEAPGNLRLAEAIRDYLERVSDPTVFKQFTIVKVSYGGKKFNHALWTVTLRVQHQLHRTSAYNEGLNERYVTFTQENHRLKVTALATGI